MNANPDQVRYSYNCVMSPCQRSQYTVQACCGAAGVSNTLRPFGFMIYPGDHFANRDPPKVKPLALDVADSRQFTIIKSTFRLQAMLCACVANVRNVHAPEKSCCHLICKAKGCRHPYAEHLEAFPALVGSDSPKDRNAKQLRVKWGVAIACNVR